MALWGGTDADETKPKFLTDAQKKQVYATAQGWVAEPGLSGNSNSSAQPEILVAFKNLAGTDAAPSSGLGLADITEIEFVTTSFDKSDGGNIDVLVRFNEEVTVDTSGGTPFVVITNDTPARNLQADYLSGSGSNELTFRETIAAANAATNAGDVLSIGANAMNLNSGTVKDKGTDDNSTITNSSTIGTAAGSITVAA